LLCTDRAADECLDSNVLTVEGGERTNNLQIELLQQDLQEWDEVLGLSAFSCRKQSTNIDVINHRTAKPTTTKSAD
jgi:hypothetical protein